MSAPQPLPVPSLKVFIWAALYSDHLVSQELDNRPQVCKYQSKVVPVVKWSVSLKYSNFSECLAMFIRTICLLASLVGCFGFEGEVIGLL